MNTAAGRQLEAAKMPVPLNNAQARKMNALDEVERTEARRAEAKKMLGGELAWRLRRIKVLTAVIVVLVVALVALSVAFVLG